MNITELDRYKLSDAVKFNARLNPKIWGKDEHLLPEVRSALLKIAEDFKEFLGISDLEVKDITVSGSNAAYTYTPHSDIDLHLVTDLPEADTSEVYRELFDAKKSQYNNQHNIKIGGYDVELYVQNANEPPVSQGEYSLLDNKWLQVPRRQKAQIDDRSTRSKYSDLKARIKSAINSDDFDTIESLARKIKSMRQSGLDQHGEFGPENLAFKMLRSQGWLGKLYDAKNAAKDQELSIEEQQLVPVKYGFKTSTMEQNVDILTDRKKVSLSEIIREFFSHMIKELGIKNPPTIKIHNDPKWTEQQGSFGRFTPETNTLELATPNRHVLDILRTMAHELVHCQQGERGDFPTWAGETGSPWEDEANAMAGRIMRGMAERHPEYFADIELVENASGYIPKNKKEAKMPQYAMALSVDIKPGQVGKEANKLGLQTGRNGEPGLLMKSANLRESRMPQPTFHVSSHDDFETAFEVEMVIGNDNAGFFSYQYFPETNDVENDVDIHSDQYRGQGFGKLLLLKAIETAQQHGLPFKPDRNGVSPEQSHVYQSLLNDKLVNIGPDSTIILTGKPAVDKDDLAESLRRELALFEEDLFEVKMTSKNLAKLAKDIPGVKVGLEFEMIVPNASVEDDEEMEPDYDEDERVRDIDDAINFFDDGDYNDRSSLRSLRDSMNEAFWEWRSEQVDNDWWNTDAGREYFEEYLDREYPFDEEEAEEEARNELQAQYGDDITPEEFKTMLDALVEEKRQNYVQEKWDDQSSEFEDAREEFTEDRYANDYYSEQDWLESEGIRYASDVESNYGNVTWPYYRSSGGSDGEADIERIALDFMNGIGADTVAYSSSYHGRYKKWVGNGWVDVGSNKPDDCFSIEPDGSLDGNSSDDVGLEFVSPPIPLEDISTVMQKVQNWASDNGVYTGKRNKTSIHTNISVPGYDLDKLDYLKAALLLGDEYVLREFDRIGNTYAAPAIEKVKQLVRQNPEKAQELLDKMKSQLNAEASKLIHSGQTNKFTSINTKDNRIEFRSPGGDYLSIIADNPQKMIDTINRMVVTMDAAMDPDKYKQEYQKKLYKVLTGQGGGREAATGKKQEMKASDKDLLNIFSRYAAGELPKQALKSFVRQAQLERKTARGEGTPGQKYWWNVQWDSNRRMEVVATNKKEAREVAAKEWGVPVEQLAVANVTMLRPYEEKPTGPTLDGRPSNPDGDWVITDPEEPGKIFYRYMAADHRDAWNVLQQWIAANPGREWKYARDATQSLGQPGESQSAQPVPGSTLDLQRQRAAATQSTTDAIRQAVGRNIAAQSAQTDQGNWGIWMINADRFANQPGEYPRGTTPALYRFPSRAAAEQWIEQQRAARPNMRTDIEVREIEPGQSAAGASREYEIFADTDPFTVVRSFYAADDQAAQAVLDQYRQDHPGTYYRAHRAPVPGSTLDLQRQRAAAGQSPAALPDIFPELPRQAVQQDTVNYELYDRNTDQAIETFTARNDREARVRLDDFSNFSALARQNPQWDVGVRRGPGVDNTVPQTTDQAQGGTVDVAGDNWSVDFERRMQQPATTGQFTGEWKVMIDGEEVYRFGGVGNSQADANRVGRDWILQQIRQRTLNPADGADVEVLPVMG